VSIIFTLVITAISLNKNITVANKDNRDYRGLGEDARRMIADRIHLHFDSLEQTFPLKDLSPHVHVRELLHDLSRELPAFSCGFTPPASSAGSGAHNSPIPCISLTHGLYYGFTWATCPNPKRIFIFKLFIYPRALGLLSAHFISSSLALYSQGMIRKVYLIF
jgi:hypothetical protein